MNSAGQVAGDLPVTRPAVAVIGMSCLLPGAPDLVRYWANLINGADAIRDVSPAEWDKSKYGPAEVGGSFQNAYTTRAGFITEFADFDPLKYGVMPNSIAGTDPDQLLGLRLAVDAITDAGYLTRDFNRDKAQVVLGRTAAPAIGVMNLIQTGQTVEQVIDVVRALSPQYSEADLDQIRAALRSSLRQCNADTIPGVMPNIISGRIATKLGFMGRNLVLDAACASSLIAVEIAVNDLLSHQADMVLAGGIHINSCAAFQQMFCGLGAVSRSGVIRPFDERADGTLVGEGAGIVVLKRLEDAIADGDRIYATIIGVGTSSDGAGTSVLAPSVEGESLAIRRALDMAEIEPSTIGLLEAHGTGTTAGDIAELQAVAQSWSNSDKVSWCALGSVKSMIGHCQAASGVAGLIKVALALYEKVLPPTINVESPVSKINWDTHPCYLNTRTRPWIHPTDWQKPAKRPRRGATSAFGFGGINAHVILEEAPYVSADDGKRPSTLQEADCELLLLTGPTADKLRDRASELETWIKDNPQANLKDLAYSTNLFFPSGAVHRAALVVRSLDEATRKLESLVTELGKSNAKFEGNLTGIYYRSPDTAVQGKLAFLLPGLGSAYVNMLSDLCWHFPVVREVFDYVDYLAVQNGEAVLPSSKIFPRTVSGDDSGSLAKMDAAVVTVLMVEYALSELLRHLEIEPDVLLGCSTGEFAAMTMSGAIDVHSAASQFYRMSVGVARSLPEERLAELKTMRVFADYEVLEPLLAELKEPVYLSSYLAPDHVILTGSADASAQCAQLLRNNAIDFHWLPIAIPYHTELVHNAVDTSQKEFKQLKFVAPTKTAWSCSTTAPLPKQSEAIRKITTELFSKPIKLRETVQKMYEDGVRLFVEIGPKGGLTTLVTDILGDQPHVAVASNAAGRTALAQINHLLAQLFVHGVPMNLDYMYIRRDPHVVDLTSRGAAARASHKLDLKYPDISLDPQFAQSMAAKLGNQAATAPATVAAPGLFVPEPVTPGFQVANPSSLSGNTPSAAQSAASYAAAPDSAQPAPVNQAANMMEHYLQTLTTFHQQLMDVQGQVIGTYFNQEDGPRPDESISALPFLRCGVESGNENEVQLSYLLTLTEDNYLLDHAIGGSVRQLYGFGERVHLLPLMVALEIMAETASLLCPNQAVVRVENVRALERIRVGAEGFAVRANARRVVDGKILVELRRGTDEVTDPMMSCEVVFADQYQATTPTEPAPAAEARPARIPMESLYTAQTMFHGPRMQAVSKLKDVSARAISGTVVDRPALDWFASLHSPLFLLNPLLLDNASQLVLYHLFEQEMPVIALLPFYIESIEFFCYPNMHEMLRGRAQMHAITDRGTQASVEVRTEYGDTVLRVNNISSRRIALTEPWLRFVHDPSSQFFSEPAPDLLSILMLPSHGEVAICDQHILGDDAVVVDWCADYLLTEQERYIWRTQAKDEQRKREWLLGRIAAKEAVRRLVARHTGIQLLPQDVEVLYDQYGRPVLAAVMAQVVGWAPFISIAHSDGVAIAVAINSEMPVGVDLQTITPRDDEFLQFAFSADEQDILKQAGANDVHRVAAQLWSAKEALAKALGTGFQGAFRNGFVVTQFDFATGAATVRAQLPEGNYICPVVTRYNDSFATALCILVSADELQPITS